ncbi:UNVERIFIED_CONTAM: hypothetical protein Sradi_5598100 [Sesamum radiatum]|uniref:Transmembrane protein n=1 Tax=Sesamum radiatum TaxID=300843 RepID=A0AAW2KZK3_SESRA
MPKHEYESLREEEKAWQKIQKPLISLSLTLISLSVLVSTVISLKIVFPDDNLRRPFCRDLRIQPLSINFTTPVASVGARGESDLLPGAFVLTDQETVDYYWMVVFVPSAVIFAASLVYLIAGITVAYSAPARHGCLKVVENNYCASRRGGVRCLSILNIVFAIILVFLHYFWVQLYSLLVAAARCPCFVCYEIACWGLVILHGGAAFFLRRKAAVILDESDFAGRNIGLEMLEATPPEVTPDMERRVNEGFKSWMGPSFLSSDEEDEPDDYLEAPSITHSNSTRQRV